MSYGQRIRELREGLGLTQQQLAEAVGVSYQAVQQWEADETMPTRDRRKRLAAALRTSEMQIEFDPRRVSEKPSAAYEVVGASRLVPLISWVQAGSFREAADPYQVGDAEDWLPAPRRAGPRTFALRVRGISMEPNYHDGEIIYVDPDAEPRNRRRVVVRLEHEKEATFKELVVEGEHRYLRALNPSWPDPLIKVDGEATICGVVIGKMVEE